MDPVVHFELPAENKKRMIDFYSKVFNWKSEQPGKEMGEYVIAITTDVDENQMIKVPGTINGGIYQKTNDPISNHPSIVIAVKDINEKIDLINNSGGKVLGKAQMIPNVGLFTSFIDTENNRVSILQPVKMDIKPLNQKIIPNLWFNGNAKEAVDFYLSVYKNSSLGKIARYGKSGSEISGRKEGDVLTIEFKLNGVDFIAINAGPEFKFNEAVSFMIPCINQAEIDYYYDKLSAVPESEICGWLKDKFGVSWQVVPVELKDLLNSNDIAKTERVTSALLKMKKLNINELKKAYDG